MHQPYSDGAFAPDGHLIDLGEIDWTELDIDEKDDGAVGRNPEGAKLSRRPPTDGRPCTPINMDVTGEPHVVLASTDTTDNCLLSGAKWCPEIPADVYVLGSSALDGVWSKTPALSTSITDEDKAARPLPPFSSLGSEWLDELLTVEVKGLAHL